MFGLIKKVFIGLLSSIINASNHTKCASLSNQTCEIQPALINLHPKECSHEFHYETFSVKLDRCVGSCNAINDLSNKECVPNKTEDLNLIYSVNLLYLIFGDVNGYFEEISGNKYLKLVSANKSKEKIKMFVVIVIIYSL